MNKSMVPTPADKQCDASKDANRSCFGMFRMEGINCRGKMLKYLSALIFILISVTLGAQTEDWLWARQAGGTQWDYSYGIATDASGNSYITGSFLGTASFGNITLSCNVNSPDIFVAKMDNRGNWLWAKQAGGTSYDVGIGITTDAGGNCFVTGHFQGIASFGNTYLESNANSTDIFIGKLDRSGNWVWVKQAGGETNSDFSSAIATDGSGNTFLTGYFQGSASFGGTTLSCNVNSPDIFIAKLDSSGNWIWVKQAGGTSYDYGRGLATDAAGNSYVTGSFQSIACFGDNSLISSGSNDIFIAKLDSSGNWNWVRRAGGDSVDNGIGIATDASGNNYVTGSFQRTASFGNTTLSSSGYYTHIFVTKLDSNGNWLWAKQAVGVTSDDYGEGITIDANGNSYVTGSFQGISSFGSTTLSSIGNYTDIFIAKLDNSGNWVWAKQAGSTHNDYGRGIATDDYGNSYATGSFRYDASFDSTTLSSSGSDDIFIAKIATPYNQVLAPNGNEQWQAGSTKTVYWNSNVNDQVNIQLSFNNGQNWIMLNTSPVDIALGRFSFTVPYVNSSQCLIKVESSSNNAIFDISDNPFTVQFTNPPNLSLTAPDVPNLKLRSGDTYHINWTAYQVNNVNLEVSFDSGVIWQPIASNLTASQGSYDWIVPDNISSSCYVRVVSSANASIYDWSNNPFTIMQLNLLTPNGGETLLAGSMFNVTWQSASLEYVKLDYSSDNGTNWINIANMISSSGGSYSWTVPATLSNHYLFRISDAEITSLYDQSPATFTVGSLAVINPNSSGLVIQANNLYTITWSQTYVTSLLKLEYSPDGGSTYTQIATNLDPTLGSYNWLVPEINTTAGLIRLSFVDDPTSYVGNYNYFTICKLALSVPNGNEVWGQQSTHAISWSSFNIPNVKLEYTVNNGQSWIPIVASTPAVAGTYNWLIPAEHSSACKVRISDSEDSIINDESNALFTIRPQIILDSPNGGESVYVYNIYRINWTVTADVSQVLIDYSSNNGSSWLPIQSTPYSASVGYYDWFVPGVITNQALIRIRRSGNDAIFDVSDAVFSIETYIVPPLAPENVAISVSGNDLHLSWSPVTQNEWGINIVPESYIIYYNNSGDPNGTYTYLYNTNSTQFTHLGVGMSNPLGFYQVTAVILTRNIPLKGDVDRYLAEHLKPGMTQAETKAILERLTEIK